MVDRSHGRRRDPGRPPKRGPGVVLMPGRPWSRLFAFAVVAVSLVGVSGSMGSAATTEPSAGLTWLRERLSDGPGLSGGQSLVLSGLVALLVGVAVLGRCALARVPGADFTRAGLGLAAVCWGSGQLVNGLLSAGGVLAAPAVGDLIAAAALPTAMIALLAAPRGSTASWPRLRLVLDAVAVGGATGFAFWQLAIASGPGLWTEHGLGVCCLVVADMTVLALVALSTVRDVRCRLWPAALGMLLHTTADVVMVAQSPSGGLRAVGVVPVVLWLLAWPLIGIGVIRYLGASTVSPRAKDIREAASAQFAAVTVVAMVTTGMFIGRTERPDVTSLVLLAEVLVLLCLRELVDSLLQFQLTTGLREQALRDGLTGLPNRRALVQHVVALESQADGWVVLTVDVDRFKEINDVLGHRAGDDLLTAVGGVLAKDRPTGSTAYRIGGDEFAVLAQGDLEEGRRLAHVIQDQLRGVLAEAAPGMAPSASVGVGRLVGGDGTAGAARNGGDHRRRHPLDRPEFGASQRAEAAEIARHELSALVESAAALRAAKLVGPGAVEIYSGQVAANRERRMLLESRLRAAVAAGRIRTVAQPIVDLATGRLTGFEALARWRDEELGDISPVEFIEIAEQTGMVIELGAHVLVVSIEHAATAGVFAAGKYVAINVSPIQLRVPGFVDLMRAQLARHGVSPELVVVEVTEAIMVAEDDPALRTLAELNALGVRVAIDDFGTGYSALGYLRRLPVQILKIDMSLTSSLTSEPRTLAIVEGVVRMAHRMGIRVVMEGIEDELEAESCRSVEADSGQGWLFGRPTEWFQVADALREEASQDAPAAVAAAVAAPVAALPAQRLQGDEPAEPVASESPEVHAGH